jgi:hypothetical protein
MMATCEFCLAGPVTLVARLEADPDQLVCAVCRDDPRVPTVPLPGLLAPEESRQALLRDMAPMVTDESTAGMAEFIAAEFSQYGVTGISWADSED